MIYNKIVSIMPSAFYYNNYFNDNKVKDFVCANIGEAPGFNEHPIIASGGLIFVILRMYKSYKIVSTPPFYLSYLFGSGTPVQQQISSEITIIPAKTPHLEAQESEILENIISSNLALIDPEKSFEQNDVSNSILSLSHSFYECFGEEQKADFIEENISFDLREPIQEVSESEAQSIEARLGGEKIIKEAAEIVWQNQKMRDINLILENKYQMLYENIDQVTSSFF